MLSGRSAATPAYRHRRGLQLNRSFSDEVIAVEDTEAFTAAHRLAQREGISAGISCGATLGGADVHPAGDGRKGRRGDPAGHQGPLQQDEGGGLRHGGVHHQHLSAGRLNLAKPPVDGQLVWGEPLAGHHLGGQDLVARSTRGFAAPRAPAPSLINPQSSKIRIKMAQRVTFVFSPGQEPQP